MTGMTSKTIRLALAGLMAVAAAAASAQSSGEAVYKAKCQGCHGAAGVPNPGIAKMMGVKAASDPAVKKMTEAQMVAAVENGMGKMKPYKGALTDEQIKASVAYYRTFAK